MRRHPQELVSRRDPSEHFIAAPSVDLSGAGMTYFVGVSGFSYPGWKGKFYPEDARSDEFLIHYSRRLGSVEVNSSFYAPPSAAMVKSWASKTGAEFRFAFKAPKLITHTLKLGRGASEAANGLAKTLNLLGARRGPILFQLPPYSKADLRLLEEFLNGTSDIRAKVFEFRNESWLDEPTYRLLEKYGAGFCIADTEEMEPTFRVTGEPAYFRLRKGSYDAKAIDQWAAKISQTARGSQECLVYLRHDETGENALLAERLGKILGKKAG